MSLKEENKDMTDMEMQQQMELQLHEQYAINNNSNLSSAMVLFVAMLAVVGAYGYVYIHSVNEFSDDLVSFVNDRGLYYLDAVMIAAIATILVLGIIIYLCISFGCRQRREQFIIYAIRKKYYKSDTIYNQIFPKDYKPTEKKGIENVQSPYDKFICILRWVVGGIALSILLSFVSNLVIYREGVFCVAGLIEFVMLMLAILLVYIYCYKHVIKVEEEKIKTRKTDLNIS